MNQKILMEKLEAHQIPVSLQRIHILSFLFENPGHYRAEEVYETLKPKVPTLSKSTVYNTLHLFSEKGLLRTLSLEEGVTHYDAMMEDHAHFICEQCHQITNVPLQEALPQIDLPGTQIHQKDLIYRGICQKCLV